MKYAGKMHTLCPNLIVFVSIHLIVFTLVPHIQMVNVSTYTPYGSNNTTEVYFSREMKDAADCEKNCPNMCMDVGYSCGGDSGRTCKCTSPSYFTPPRRRTTVVPYVPYNRTGILSSREMRDAADCEENCSNMCMDVGYGCEGLNGSTCQCRSPGWFTPSRRSTTMVPYIPFNQSVANLSNRDIPGWITPSHRSTTMVPFVPNNQTEVYFSREMKDAADCEKNCPNMCMDVGYSCGGVGGSICKCTSPSYFTPLRRNTTVFPRISYNDTANMSG